MRTYVQRTGALFDDDLCQVVLALGYSGFGPGKNDPQFQQLADVGPIPCGLWTVEGPPADTHGGFALRLTPKPGTETFGRSGFLMHGDMADPELRGTASHGCIIMPRWVREWLWGSTDHDLQVIAEQPEPDGVA